MEPKIVSVIFNKIWHVYQLMWRSNVRWMKHLKVYTH